MKHQGKEYTQTEPDCQSQEFSEKCVSNGYYIICRCYMKNQICFCGCKGMQKSKAKQALNNQCPVNGKLNTMPCRKNVIQTQAHAYHRHLHAESHGTRTMHQNPRHMKSFCGPTPGLGPGGLLKVAGRCLRASAGRPY